MEQAPKVEGTSSGTSALSAGFDGHHYSTSKKRGCPTCDGIDPKSCMRCRGRTRLCDWVNTEMGWTHNVEITGGFIACVRVD
jgi:hypothetical protein